MVLNDARQFSTTQAVPADGPSRTGEMQGAGTMPTVPLLSSGQGMHEMRHAAPVPTSQAVPILKSAQTSLVAGCQGRASHLLASVSELCPAALERLLLSG